VLLFPPPACAGSSCRCPQDGFIETNLGLYKEPSPALGNLVSTQINGWANWKHVPSEKTLRQLRFQLEQGGAPAGQ
jgi:hypothetical protein